MTLETTGNIMFTSQVETLLQTTPSALKEQGTRLQIVSGADVSGKALKALYKKERLLSRLEKETGWRYQNNHYRPLGTFYRTQMHLLLATMNLH